MHIKESQIQILPPSIIKVSSYRIMALLGYTEPEQEDPGIKDILDECLTIASNLYEPKAALVIYPHNPETSDREHITIENFTFRTHRIVTAQLKQATQVAAYLCTIGPGIETCSKQLMMEGDGLKAYILDLIGSEATECIAEYLHEHVREHARFQKMHPTNRFSPGYCQWDVAEQHLLFPLLPAEACGISLSESALMYPVKSTSGIIGIGYRVKESPYPCAFCQQTGCTFREIRKPQSQTR